MNLKVQQLAKEQQQCHKEVNSHLGEAADGEEGALGGETQASSLTRAGGPPALLCSCSRPTVSSAGGSPNTTSVSRDTWARPSSRCRWGFPHPALGSWRVPSLPEQGYPLRQ